MTAGARPSHQEYHEALYEMEEEGIPYSASTSRRMAGGHGCIRLGGGEAPSSARAGLHVGRTTYPALVRRQGPGPHARSAAPSCGALPGGDRGAPLAPGAPGSHPDWGRVVSEDVERRFVELLGDPATCVHGNPIPGSSHAVEHEALQRGLMPGADIAVFAVAPDGTRTLEIAGEKVALGEHLADNLWIRAPFDHLDAARLTVPTAPRNISQAS
jgi:Fe2+ transport system protein FeoA